ncbi:acyl carrier protein [Laceyella sacchari]|jgi:acyl carrier protein|uniref:Acyl carrier protein n=1 Tax=Laceyella sacchari TaxID=37482 RepID=A0ABY5U2B5_LACSH|nr:acyl carrier protein [Laceyella sacchari]KPC72470.1 acyl carrier protein [Thermoactinomyces vulgaris]TCW38985.1 acyl carrier protein [Laceyella sacchari]UWE03319.1 acyl carrier protein [Laceyella sacchari]UYO72935.1 TheG [Laceyella sacchari]
MVYEKFKEMIVALGIPAEEVHENAYLRQDLALDSTETVQLSLELKKQFGVQVKIAAREDKTVKDICDLVKSELDKKNGEAT